ncbi:serine hydrolase domain-containing protein [Yoonia sp. 2307UL14-13]|uniref:serine hydrolase domain-containing protein n=1 Tax=Yoonia sp. 2307UL14-13 TaxID=3126506 RepID=UPI0030AC1547
MKSFLKWTGRILILLALVIVAVGIWKREEIGRLGTVLTLFDEENIVGNFSNMNAAFLNTPLDRGDGPASELPVGDQVTLPAPVQSWITDRSITGLVILKDGAVVYEDYFKGTGPDDIRINWSISKSYLSALFGVLLDEGTFESLDEPVTKYAPSLVGTAYEDTSIKDVLQMSSGIVFNEDYLDFWSDINKMGRVLALGASMDTFAAGQDQSFAPPGEIWKYVSIDTHVIGMVIRGATGHSVIDLLSEKIIQPLGMESEVYYVTDGFGVAFVLGGLNTTTRDNARFGQMIAEGGRWNGQQIVPADWVDAATVPSANTAVGSTGYGYQWWIPAGATDGQFMARGIYGQYIYIDRINDVVISVHAADRRFREPGVSQQNEDMFRLIAESLN